MAEKIKNAYYNFLEYVSNISLSARQKKDLYKIGASLLLLIVALFFSKLWIVQLIICLIAYAICAYDIIRKAISRIAKGNVFDENTLMTVASIGAFVLGEFSEGVAVMLLYQIGEFFQDMAVTRSRNSIKAMMELRADTVHKVVVGEVIDVDTDTIGVGDIILVRPGERVPVDGIVIDGVLEADTSAITGESLPVTLKEGDTAVSGYINLSGVVRIRTTACDEDSTVSRILRIVEEQSENKSENERFITRFAKYYTPAVFALTLIVAIVVPLIFGNFRMWIYRALSLLAISCPCALVLSIPLTYFSAVGKASSYGILMKGGSVVDALEKCDTLVLDKTGTLTTGKLHITEAVPSEIANEQILLTVAAISEGQSNHPIAKAISAYVKEHGFERRQCDRFVEKAGRGTLALVDSHTFVAGEADFLEEIGVEGELPRDDSKKCIYFALDKKYVGYIAVGDKIKPGAEDAILDAREAGINTVGMFSGDRKAIAEAVASKLRLDMCEGELSPTDKLDKIKELKDYGNSIMFAGDGINDAPTLVEADVGVAMGDIGSDAALEAADVVIMNGELSKLAQAINLAKHAIVKVKQNIGITLGIKLLVLILTLCGVANMTAAIFADVGVAVIAILNAMRQDRI